jgi:hypothetical protein
MREVIHREYYIGKDEFKKAFGITGSLNTVEYDYQSEQLVIKMAVEER